MSDTAVVDPITAPTKLPAPPPVVNRNLILIAGKSAAGKSASLRNLQNPTQVIYLNCEAGKELPFVSKFKKLTVTHPHQIYKAFEEAERLDVHTVIVDSLTYMMDMYETMMVINATNTMKAWGDYAQFFKRLMHEFVARSSRNVIFTAHTMDVLNEGEMIMETLVKVKGSLMNQGIESYFSNVIAAKKIQTKRLEGYKNDMLDITPLEESLGFKYVFQTQLTRETVNERIRGHMGLWSPQETYVDNDIQKVLNHLHAYYN